MPSFCKIFINKLQNRDKLKQYRKAVRRAICNVNTMKKAGILQKTTQSIPSNRRIYHLL